MYKPNNSQQPLGFEVDNQSKLRNEDEQERIKTFLNNRLNESFDGHGLFNRNFDTPSPFTREQPHHHQGSALTSLLKHQLKQSTMETRPTTMNEILKMVMMAGPLPSSTLGLQQQKDSVMIDKLGSYAGMINTQSSHDPQVISDFNDLKSRSQVLEREMKQITEMSSSQDRCSLKESVLSVLYQIIDEVLSDTTSSLPLCWSTSNSNKGESAEQLIKTLSLKWKNDYQQYSSNNSMQQHLYQYLSKHSFLTNQELIDLMVNSHNLLDTDSSIKTSDSQTLNNSTSQNILQMETTNMTTEEEIYSLFPSAEDFDMVFKSLGESSNAPLIISLDNSMDDIKITSSAGDSVASSRSNNSSPLGTPNNITTDTIANNNSPPSFENPSSTKQLIVKKTSPTSSKTTSKSSNVDKNQLFGSFLLKTSSSFDTTKISKTRKSSKSAPAQLVDKQKLEVDFSRGFLNWNWKEQPKRSNHHEPEIM
ncbi:predicted protein [Naegleria gruberi]|uniref:Predicted protein n=1 Tax=Naegleria gruberi TaxID=5762 RepID=D2V585_NAEGR|nr:uncharacterized protein NAEGRDRAFT_57183 [Naegleria gruberi]EFC48066.1 predicted protein [Naegleria gruberi]|eukprot:XP_002680810.1 predicted protein [Naegleria gruberi strain NEG-M]